MSKRKEHPLEAAARKAWSSACRRDQKAAKVGGPPEALAATKAERDARHEEFVAVRAWVRDGCRDDARPAHLAADAPAGERAPTARAPVAVANRAPVVRAAAAQVAVPVAPPAEAPVARILSRAIRRSIVNGLLVAGAMAGMRGSYALISATLEGLAPGSGPAGASVLIAGEAVFGHVTQHALRGKGGLLARVGAAAIPALLVLLAVGSEAVIASSRVEVAQRVEVKQVLNAQPAAVGPVIECPKPESGEVPEEFRGSKWRAAQWQQRHDQAEAKRMDCVALQQKATVDAAARADQDRNSKVNADTQATETEKAVPVLVAIVAAFATSLGSSVVDRFLKDLLLVISLACGRKPAPRRAPAAAPDPSPVPVPDPMPAQGEVAAPTASGAAQEALWSRIARWPLIRRILRSRQSAPGAA